MCKGFQNAYFFSFENPVFLENVFLIAKQKWDTIYYFVRQANEKIVNNHYPANQSKAIDKDEVKYLKTE